MSDQTYADSDKYIVINPTDPKVAHQMWDAPLRDPKTKEYVKDENGKIQVVRLINWGTKGLTRTQIEALISERNADLVDDVTGLKNTVTTFLTGDPNDNGLVDRLSELVNNISANKGSIDSIISGYVKVEDYEKDKATFVTEDGLTITLGSYLTQKNITDDLKSQATDKAPTAKNMSDAWTHLTTVARNVLTMQELVTSLASEVALLKQAGGGSSSDSNVITKPSITNDQIIIGVPCTFHLSAKSLLNEGSIESFSVTLTNCEGQTVAAVNGDADVTFTLPNTVADGASLSMSVIAKDNADNTSAITTISLTAHALPAVITAESSNEASFNSITWGNEGDFDSENETLADDASVLNGFVLAQNSTTNLSTNAIYVAA